MPEDDQILYHRTEALIHAQYVGLFLVVAPGHLSHHWEKSGAALIGPLVRAVTHFKQIDEHLQCIGADSTIVIIAGDQEIFLTVDGREDLLHGSV